MDVGKPSWTTPIAPRHVGAAYSLPAQRLKETLAALTGKARSVESEPAKLRQPYRGIRRRSSDIDFVFACEAETLILQPRPALTVRSPHDASVIIWRRRFFLSLPFTVP